MKYGDFSMKKAYTLFMSVVKHPVHKTLRCPTCPKSALIYATLAFSKNEIARSQQVVIKEKICQRALLDSMSMMIYIYIKSRKLIIFKCIPIYLIFGGKHP